MKKWLGFGMTLVMLATAAVSAMAADIQKGKAEIRPDFTIVIDGETKNFKRADGSAAYALIYKDTTYLPLRAIGEALDKNVNWDEDTKTVTLSGRRDAKDSSNKYISGKVKEVTIQVRPDFTIVMDGEELEFKTAAGKNVYPLLYDGSTYLPLRAIGEIMDKDVDWDQKDKTVTLTDDDDYDDDYTVTDADSFGDDDDRDDWTDKWNGRDIGMGKAKEIALNAAKVKNVKDVKFIQTKMEREDGRKQHDIEFYYNGKVYGYDVDALTGKCHKDDVEGWKADKYHHDDDEDIDEDFSVYPKNVISEDKATSIALKHADLKAKEVSNLEADLDSEKGKVIYEVEFEKGHTEYSYKIDAKTGKILDFEKDIDD